MSSNTVKKTLFVSNLPADVTNEDIENFFSFEKKKIPLERFIISRNNKNGTLNVYTFVTFLNEEDAKRALETRNYQQIKKRPIQLTWPDISNRSSREGYVFLSKLLDEFDEYNIYDIFKAYAGVISCYVARDEKGNSKGYGYVQFDSKESAKYCLSKKNDKDILDVGISIEEYIPYEKRRNEKTNVYVNNFKNEIDEQKLKEIFGKTGDIISYVLKKTHDGKQYGLVNYRTSDQANKTIKALNGNKIKGFGPLYVVQAKTKRELKVSNIMHNVYVKIKNAGFKKNLTKEDLQNLFGNSGEIENIRIGTISNRNYGIITFKKKEDADKAIYQLNNQKTAFGILYLAHAEGKDDRNKCWLFVGNIHKNIVKNKLKEIFGKYKFKPLSIILKSDDFDRKYAIVRFKSSVEALNVLKNLNGKKEEEKELFITIFNIDFKKNNIFKTNSNLPPKNISLQQQKQQKQQPQQQQQQASYEIYAVPPPPKPLPQHLQTLLNNDNSLTIYSSPDGLQRQSPYPTFTSPVNYSPIQYPMYSPVMMAHSTYHPQPMHPTQQLEQSPQMQHPQHSQNMNLNAVRHGMETPTNLNPEAASFTPPNQ